MTVTDLLKMIHWYLIISFVAAEVDDINEFFLVVLTVEERVKVKEEAIFLCTRVYFLLYYRCLQYGIIDHDRLTKCFASTSLRT